MSGQAREHYDRLAANYDANWSHGSDFIAWMSGAITSRLVPHDRIDWVADIGCGTGLFARSLKAVAQHVVCVDPSLKMLAELPSDLNCVALRASAEDIAAGRVALPHGRMDAILVKEAIHHVEADVRWPVLAGLAKLLAPRGRLLVVMLPTRIDYPLFPAALELFERLQPDPEDVAASMSAAGLTVDLSYDSFSLSLPQERYLGMVRARYMSLLSMFDDATLEAGIVEMDTTSATFDFVDRFAFITGVAEE
ncbi:class I SAM-dependent methyltransferase [Nocardia salmonicida]|uniref:class I SAM-dependent methyltransferase n=1 Tax=Nocardia salmonicida TaxID=53431 RepID=UPI0007A5338B|nr:class I SAM-dependent methyltransferase [Nocardia salmonicida]